VRRPASREHGAIEDVGDLKGRKWRLASATDDQPRPTWLRLSCSALGRPHRRVLARGSGGSSFGVAAGVGGDEPDFRVAELKAGELVCKPAAVDVLELEQRRVSGLDDDGGERKLGDA
jgi:hypothetical protein